MRAIRQVCIVNGFNPVGRQGAAPANRAPRDNCHLFRLATVPVFMLKPCSHTPLAALRKMRMQLIEEVLIHFRHKVRLVDQSGTVARSPDHKQAPLFCHGIGALFRSQESHATHDLVAFVFG